MSEQKEQKVKYGFTLLTDEDVYLFREGSHYRLYDKLGSHIAEYEKVKGVYFAVWAPNAKFVSVTGNFNGWDRRSHPLEARWDSSGIWEGFIPGIGEGEIYKYYIESRFNGYCVEKADPFAFGSEEPPKTASIVRGLDYEWNDKDWMGKRKEETNNLRSPMSVYEMHLGSWRKRLDGKGQFFGYREIAGPLVDYIKKTGFTHIEFLPLMEHPFYGSWGYQTCGYFSPTSRFGDAQDLMYLIDELHKNDIGVIFDWVPSHFPSDEHGIGYFDGTYLFEHEDINQRVHPDWQSLIFNYGRNEVRAFLISSAMYWLDKYHIDGLRVDAVASMLYRDYSRKEGEWTANQYGGRENIEAIDFLRQFNEAVYKDFPGIQTIAEESTAWPMVSRPTYAGGLGFGMKWNMGWMHDTLDYFSREPVYRKYHHGQISFGIWYAFNENFVLPLSHDEIVHGKGSLLNKMPGDEWQKFANLRLLYSFMFSHPGKKLLFMGAEIAQRSEWNHENGLDWDLLSFESHQGINQLICDLNKLYRSERSLYDHDFEHRGFEWVDLSDSERSVVSYLRKGVDEDDVLLCICNFTPSPHKNYRVGVPFGGMWKEVINSDSEIYGGSGWGNYGKTEAAAVPYYDKYDYSLVLTLPPLGMLMLRPDKGC